MLNVKRGWRYPFLVLLAVIFWCIPIATIFPPATLSVESAHAIHTSMRPVPQFDFTTFNMVAGIQSGVSDPEGESISDEWSWTGPSQPLQHIALAVMGLGQILPITLPAPNASWTLEFWGPALQCDNVAATERDRIWTNVWNSYNGTTTGPYAFLSWVPGSGTDPDLPFSVNSSGGATGPPSATLSTGGPASRFVAVLPETQNLMLATKGPDFLIFYNGSVPTDCSYQTVQNLDDPIAAGCAASNGTFSPALVYKDSTLLRCDLVNTSYSVDFNSSSGVLDVQASLNMTGKSPIVNATDYFVASGPLGVPNMGANCSSFQAYPVPDGKGTPCVLDIDSVRLLSYQGIMSAFDQLVVGTIQNLGSSVGVNTEIMRTILAETNELAFIRDWSPDGLENYADLQSAVASSAGWAYPGLVNLDLPDTRGGLKSTLENLFQNLTMSLLSEPYFQPNYSSHFAPPNSTNVTLPTYQNVYNYDRVTLLIAYGLSILFTTLAVVAGMISLVLSGASYSHNFSTIIRVGRVAKLSVEVLDRDGLGADPLPTYLKHARLDMEARSIMMANDEHEMTETPAEEQMLVVGHKDTLSMD